MTKILTLILCLTMTSNAVNAQKKSKPHPDINESKEYPNVIHSPSAESTPPVFRSVLQMEIVVREGADEPAIRYADGVVVAKDGLLACVVDAADSKLTAENIEGADVLLLDTRNQFAPKKVAETRGWNPQQGAMMYWHPAASDTQFFFNDRDPRDGTVFTVLFDIHHGDGGARVKEYRFADSPVANSGVARSGSHFLALNYGRLARCRLVTGYAGLHDWSQTQTAPENDGIFKVDVRSGARTLLVSYKQLQGVIRQDTADVESFHLFINHTLWNQSDSRVYFYSRANFKSKLPKVDVPFTLDADGSNLTRHPHLGGHPEWDSGTIMIGAQGDRQVRYDTSAKKIVGIIGEPGMFSSPGGDIAFDSTGHWFVNGHKRKDLKQTFFTIFNRRSNRIIRTEGFPVGDVVSGALRVDPAPRWDRDSSQILIGAWDANTKTRQLFLLTLKI